MASDHAVFIDTNNITKQEIDPETLKKIFGSPKDSEKTKVHTVNEHPRDSFAMTNSNQPLLSTSNTQNNSLPSDPDIGDGSKNSVPDSDTGPQPTTVSFDNNTGVPDSNKNVGTVGPQNLPKPSDHTLEEGADKDHFQWWSSDDDPPHDEGANGLESRFGEVPAIPTSLPTGTPDVNAYQQRKNLAHGMMDLALLSANATQLRAVVESSSHPYFYPGVTFVSLSIILQITVGILLILNSRFDVTKKSEIQNAIRVNDITVVGVFLVTIINVFIASFIGTSPTGGSTAQPAPQQ